MLVTTAEHQGFDPRKFRPALVLMTGALLWALSVGGRWDIAIAAWCAPVLVLRYARITSPLIGLAIVWMLSIAVALWWIFQVAVPITPITLGAGLAFGTIQWLPYLLDRTVGMRLSTGSRLLLFPAAIVSAEWAMGAFSPLGTAYGLKAVTQYANLPLLQMIGITGPYGIGFLIAWFATTVNHVWEQEETAKISKNGMAAFVAILTLILIGGALRLAWSSQPADYVRVAGIVPSRAVLNISNDRLGYDLQGGTRPPVQAELARIDPALQSQAFTVVHDELIENTRKAARAGAKLVVWSENAAVTRKEELPRLLARIATIAREEGIYLNAAVNIPFLTDETHLFGPDGRELWVYRKARPIPGLEVYSPGDGKIPVVDTPFGRIANVICYDADFPALLKGVDADILLVPGGDWPEIGRVHTLRMSSLRAIESGFALFRQDFNGFSAAFDRYGNVLATQDTTRSDRSTFFADVPIKGKPTLYRIFGDVFAMLCSIAVLGWTVNTLMVRVRKKQ